MKFINEYRDGELAQSYIAKIKDHFNSDYTRVLHKAKLSEAEMKAWKEVSEQMYFPWSDAAMERNCSMPPLK